MSPHRVTPRRTSPELARPCAFTRSDSSAALADLIATPAVDGRRQKIASIQTLLAAAASGFGSNLTYQIGDGPLMF